MTDRAIYCTARCDVCRDYADRRGLPLIASTLTREPGPDAERLSEAIFRVGISLWRDERCEPLPWAVEHQQEWAHWLGQAQSAIAREYAALASEDRT